MLKRYSVNSSVGVLTLCNNLRRSKASDNQIHKMTIWSYLVFFYITIPK